MGTGRRLSPDARREQLCEVAGELLASTPFESFSLDLLAQRAGVTRQLVYRYYPGKQEVFRDVLSRALDRLVAQFTAVFSGQKTGRARPLVAAFFDFVSSQGHGVRSLYRNPGIAGAEGQKRIELFRQMIVQASAARFASEPGELLLSALRGWLAAVERVVPDVVAAGNKERAQTEELLVELLYHSVLAAATVARDDRLHARATMLLRNERRRRRAASARQ